MKQWLIFLPLNHNDGTKVAANILRELELLLTKRFGGATYYPKAEGIYLNGALELIQDKVKVVQVVAPSTEDTNQFMVWYGKLVKRLLKQEVVLLINFPIETIWVDQ